MLHALRLGTNNTAYPLMYNQALLWEYVGDGQRAIGAARSAVFYYHQDQIIGPGDGHGALDEAQVTAHLADARARLCRLLGAHGIEDHLRRRQLKAYFQDPDLSLYSEISTLDAQAYHAYRDLIKDSRFTQEDLARIKKQGEEAFRSFAARYPGRR